MPSLVFKAGPNSGRRYKLGQGDYIIGRRSDCQIFVPDMRVSRQHARVRLERGRWSIEDLGSNNGTFVNGHRIQASIPLRHEDEIAIANNKILVEIPEEAAAERRREVDAHVTIVDLDNARIVRASEDSPSASFWMSTSGLAGVQDSQRRERLLERKIAALTSVLEISAHSAEPSEMLGRLCAQLLDVFPRAGSVGVLVEEAKTGELRVLTHETRQTSESRAPFGGDIEVPGTIIDHVVKDRRGILLSEAGSNPLVAEAQAGEPAGSRMGAPIQAKDQSYGVIYVEADAHDLRQEDVDLLTSIAAQAGLAIHSARAQQELARQRRLERDLRVARQIQRSLLPQHPPEVHGLSFAVHYEPAYEIGGDFYDFIWHDPERLALVIGDVAGKAISAALYMARLTSELRSRAPTAATPSRLLRRVNEEMMRLGDDGMFATLIYAIYDLGTRTLLFTNAGHVVPMLRRGGQLHLLESERAHVAPLGVTAGMEIGEAKVHLQVGDMLVLTTDGIHEARDPSGHEYGDKRLRRRIQTARGGPDDVVKAILQDVDSHVGKGGKNPLDDMTVLAMEVRQERARRATTVPGLTGDLRATTAEFHED